jgi:phosphoglycolate phosphatase
MSDAIKAVIFDLDGTLLDTLQDLADSGNDVLAARGMPTHSVEAYKTFIGNGMMSLVQDIFPPEHRPADGEESEVILAEYREAYGRNWKNTTCVFPGMGALLDELKAKGIPVGVLSNKAHDFTVKCVDAFLADWKWDVVLGARDGVERKPNPAGAIEAAALVGFEPAECAYVGDSDVDMFTAVNAGMLPVAVSWGFRSEEELRAAGAKVFLQEPGELLAVL